MMTHKYILVPPHLSPRHDCHLFLQAISLSTSIELLSNWPLLPLESFICEISVAQVLTGSTLLFVHPIRHQRLRYSIILILFVQDYRTDFWGLRTLDCWNSHQFLEAGWLFSPHRDREFPALTSYMCQR